MESDIKTVDEGGHSSAAAKMERNSPPSVGIAIATSRWADKLAKLDVNKDGHVDASEIAAMVDELVKEQALQRVYKFIAIGLFIVVMVLIGALTGITWAIVNMSKETKVSEPSTAVDFKFLLSKDGSPTVTGGPIFDLGALSQRMPDLASNASNLTSASGRRRLLVDDSTLQYYASVDMDAVVDAGCNLIKNGLQTTLVMIPSSLTIPNGNVVTELSILEQSGCESPDRTDVTARVRTSDGEEFYLVCTRANGVCVVYFDTTTYNPASHNTTARHRRRHLSAVPLADRCAVPKQQQEATLEATEGEGSAPCCAECHSPYVLDGCQCLEPEQLPHCFPADATVAVAGRGAAVRMDELQYGDLVLSRDRSSGALVYRPVYLFGHRTADGMLPYVHISTSDGSTLVATAGHLVPVCVESCTAEDIARGSALLQTRRAGDVRPGDLLVTATATNTDVSTVEGVQVLSAQGAFNPYVRGADIVVDGVLASPHSEWLLDAYAPAWMVPYLPYIYEAMLAPVYGLYCIVGPATAEWLAHGLGLAESGADPRVGHAGYFAVLAGMAAPVALAAVLVGRGTSKTVRQMIR